MGASAVPCSSRQGFVYMRRESHFWVSHAHGSLFFLGVLRTTTSFLLMGTKVGDMPVTSTSATTNVGYSLCCL